MNVEKRQEIERKVVRHLIRTMKKHGWGISRINDGGDLINPRTEGDAMDTVFSVDECWIRFHKITMHKVAYILLGNDGWDCICDHSLSDPDNPDDDFEKIMREEVDIYTDKLSEGLLT